MSIFSIHKEREERGFTLVEIIVSLAVISILATVVYASLGEARKKARDTQRKSDIEQIQLAFRLWKEVTGGYPTSASYNLGVVIGEGGGLDNATTGLGPYVPTIPSDPSGPAGTTYDYMYDSSYTCGGTARIVLYAKTMERGASAGNWATACGTPYTDGTSASTYGVILQ